MTEKQIALYYFRKLLYCLYREIGILKPRNHPVLAQKARLDSSFFSKDRKRQAAEIYHQTESEGNTSHIIEPYHERTVLSLDELFIIFKDGKWENSTGGYSYGGPKWAKIADATISLQKRIESEDWEDINSLISKIDLLAHNNGKIIDKFKDT